MRRILPALAIWMTLAPMVGADVRHTVRISDPRISAERLVDAPIGQMFGALRLEEAWQLTSRDSRFGGVSGLALVGPRAMMMVSDGGEWFAFTLTPAGRVLHPRFSTLPSLSRTLKGKSYRDAESLVRDPQTGRIWLGMEGTGQIWRFDNQLHRTARRRHPAMAGWPANRGAEALARLPDRRFVALAEGALTAGRGTPGLVFGGDPADRRTPSIAFRYDAGGKGAVTDAAALPDGRLLVLHRQLGASPIMSSAVAIASPRGIKTGTILRSHLLATLTHPALAENYEGMAVWPDGNQPSVWPDGNHLSVWPDGNHQATWPDGNRLSVWLVSDDNQNDWQRTLLLRFSMRLPR